MLTTQNEEFIDVKDKILRLRMFFALLLLLVPSVFAQCGVSFVIIIVGSFSTSSVFDPEHSSQNDPQQGLQ